MPDQSGMGTLREVVQVQHRTTQANGYGEPVATWTTLQEVRAQVASLGGSEVWRAGKVEAEHSYRVLIRYLDYLTPRHRFLWRDKALEVESIQPDEKRTWALCVCREVVT